MNELLIFIGGMSTGVIVYASAQAYRVHKIKQKNEAILKNALDQFYKATVTSQPIQPVRTKPQLTVVPKGDDMS